MATKIQKKTTAGENAVDQEALDFGVRSEKEATLKIIFPNVSQILLPLIGTELSVSMSSTLTTDILTLLRFTENPPVFRESGTNQGLNPFGVGIPKQFSIRKNSIIRVLRFDRPRLALFFFGLVTFWRNFGTFGTRIAHFLLTHALTPFGALS